MYDFIRLMYLKGNLTNEQVMTLVPKWITKDEAVKLIKHDLTAQ